MSKVKTKELIICILAIMVLILSIMTDVFARDDIDTLTGNKNKETEQIENKTDDDDDDLGDDDDDLGDDDDDDLGDDDDDDDSGNNNSAGNNSNSRNNNSNNNTPKMPNAGVDYSIVFVIVVCGVSTIYAYKKIRDYKNF